MVDICECSEEHLSCIKCGEFLDRVYSGPCNGDWPLLMSLFIERGQLELEQLLLY